MVPLVGLLLKLGVTSMTSNFPFCNAKMLKSHSTRISVATSDTVLSSLCHSTHFDDIVNVNLILLVLK